MANGAVSATQSASPGAAFSKTIHCLLLLYAFVSDDKASIKEWMAGKNKNICGKDLITDQACVPGYEADFVIYLGPNDNDVSAYMSRCRGQFVHIVI